MNSFSQSRNCTKLFEPLTVKSMVLKNRIVMTAMHLNYTPQGMVTQQLIDFYRERVAGGVGLIVIGGCTVDDISGGSFMIGGWDDKFNEGLAWFVREMKKEDPTVMLSAQLYHAGAYAMSFLTGKQPVSASMRASRFNPETPRALEIDEIAEYQSHFASAAARMKACGFDTVEIIASAGYLISQFLSPVTNRREDRYGGPFENRVRFGVETIQAVRNAVGPKYPVMVRIAGSDHVPGGHTNAESRQVAQHFEKAGADLFNVTGGWHEASVPQLTMSVPRGTYIYLAHGIKKSVNVPVIACNRVNDPLYAEEILQFGKADLVGVARGLIADPEFPNKARLGKYHLIRKCIACNQGCFDHVFMGDDVNCLVNYRAGREARFRLLEKTTRPKKVVVIGGGPGGCEAARIAAKKGHQVVLFEKTDRLGGSLHLCAAPPGRREFLELARYQEADLREMGVEIRLCTEATVEALSSERPDLVLAAYGADPIVPPFVKAARMKNVFLAEDVLLGKEVCYGDTVVIGGGAVGCETALFLAHQGRLDPEAASFLIETGGETADRVSELLVENLRHVYLVEMLPKIGEDIGKSTRWTMMLDLRRSQVQIHRKTKVLAIEEKGVLVEGPDGQEALIECDNAVVAIGYRANDSLTRALREAGVSVQVIGDAQSPRRAIDAIGEGFQAGWDL